MTFSQPSSTSRPRLLVFILTYEAASHIAAVIARVPRDLEEQFDTHVLVIDDGSTDGTAEIARDALRHAALPYGWTVLANPHNQGYGGNQKLGYHWAIEHKFDVVVMVHGDGQYPPEQVGPLAELAYEHGAAFGSRLAVAGQARRGGMPAYKYVGNRILTKVQNRVLKSRLTEFHSGFRGYRTDVLQSIPYALNSNDFHFDTEIFIQCLRIGIDIAEMPIPTHYGDEVCRVNGIGYAFNVLGQTMRASLHDKGLFYERKYRLEDVPLYESKLGFASPAQYALDRIPPGSVVLDLGSSDGHLAGALRAKGCTVIGVDLAEPATGDPFDEFIRWNLDHGLPPIDRRIDVVVMADVIEHLRAPEDFAEQLAEFCRTNGVRRLLVSTGNVAFVVQRAMLLLGQFNYGPRGILDMTHTRLFTVRTIRRLFRQAGFTARQTFGLPAPFPFAIGDRWPARALLRVNEAAIRVSKSLFSYQIFLVLDPPPDVGRVIAESTMHTVEEHAGWP
jgi:glycosyltransferase involved in cell wall biosynthesis